MRKLLAEKRMRAIVSLPAERLDNLRPLAKHFSAVEIDFTENLNERTACAALRKCEQAGLEVKAVHLPNPRRLTKMAGSRKIPRSLLGLHETIFVFHAWMRGDAVEENDLGRMVEKLALNSNTAVIENMSNPKKMFSSASEVEQYFRSVVPFRFCLDTSHPVPRNDLSTTNTILAYLRAAAGSLGHVHLSDADLRDGRKHLPLGKGKIEWDPFFIQLRAMRYTGLLTLEIEGASCGDLVRSLELLSRHDISTEDDLLSPLLSVIDPADAAAFLSQLFDEWYKAPFLKLLADKGPLLKYSDERVRAVLFDKAGAAFLPFMAQMNFPREIPLGKGFVSLVMDSRRISALYLCREEKVAVRTTVVDLSDPVRSRSIADFLYDIETARSIAYGSSKADVVRFKDGKTLT